MWPFLKNLVLDEGKFVGFFRAVLMGLGGSLSTGLLDATIVGLPDPLGQVIGIGSLMGAGLIRSSAVKPNHGTKPE